MNWINFTGHCHWDFDVFQEISIPPPPPPHRRSLDILREWGSQSQRTVMLKWNLQWNRKWGWGGRVGEGVSGYASLCHSDILCHWRWHHKTWRLSIGKTGVSFPNPVWCDISWCQWMTCWLLLAARPCTFCSPVWKRKGLGTRLHCSKNV